MLVVRQSDIKHRYQMIRLLTKVIDDKYLSQVIGFKGGTCAEMSGFLDRFSIDLDFDITNSNLDKNRFQLEIDKITTLLNLSSVGSNNESYFYNFKYEAPPNQRNTLKLSFFENVTVSNEYEFRFLPDIGRLIRCQTLETMFANKLVAPLDRFKKHNSVVGRDIYDIYYFFSQGYHYKTKIIKERTGLTTKQYLKRLIQFIEDKITDKVITEDLNTLLPLDKFTKVRKILKDEVLAFLRASISLKEEEI